MSYRSIQKVFKAKPTREGAGVYLRRVFSNPEALQTDPFLLLDDFRSDDPSKYLAGFPWHPHRGIETITYMLKGMVDHGDSMGNSGTIGPGDVQWMTAGSGIIHQEMPKGDTLGRMYGFQLWANLPASYKMMPPRYREIKAADIPEVTIDKGVRVKVICGMFAGVTGPAGEIVTNPTYLDIYMPPDTSCDFPVGAGVTVIAYVYEGAGTFGREQGVVENGSCVLFGDGDEIFVEAHGQGVRLLLLSGKPLKEPIAWSGPIVMNTEEELEKAFREYENGTFVK